MTNSPNGSAMISILIPSTRNGSPRKSPRSPRSGPASQQPSERAAPDSTAVLTGGLLNTRVISDTGFDRQCASHGRSAFSEPVIVMILLVPELNEQVWPPVLNQPHPGHAAVSA